MDSTNGRVQPDEQDRSDSDSLLARVWRTSEGRPRAIWRILVPVAVFASLGIGLGRLIEAVGPDTVLVTETNLALLAGTVGAVITECRLADRSLADLGLEPSGAWVRDLLVGIVFGVVFQLAVTAAWLAVGDLSFTATLQPGIGTGVVSLTALVIAVVVKFAVVGLWEEYVFRSLSIRNVAQGLAGRGVSRRTAVGASLLGVGAVFGVIHAFGAAVAFTNPVFGAVQAFASVSYFVLAYVVTGRLGLSVGIHFVSNAWVRIVVGEPGTGYPKLVAAERVAPGLGETSVFLLPTVLLMGLILAWGRYTDGDVASVSEQFVSS